MIKEIFEIEPKQKNLLIILFAISCISFLQIYLFSPETFEKGSIVVIGLSLAITVCWAILNAPPLVLFSIYINPEENADINTEINIAQFFMFGLLGVFWILLITYISYEIDLTPKNFARVSIGVCVLRTVAGVISLFRKDHKKK